MGTLLSVFVATQAVAMESVLSAGLKGDGVTDNTERLQAALDSGPAALEFPAGVYVLGAVEVHADTVLSFHPSARLLPLREKLVYSEELDVKGKKRKVEHKIPLFAVRGSRVRLEGLRFDFCAAGTERDPTPVETLVRVEGGTNVVVSGFHVEASSPKRASRRVRLRMFDAADSSALVVENCSVSGITYMLWTTYCENVTVRGNRMTGGDAMTTFAFGSQSLRHHDNWSRNVGYQCVWRGGSPDPSRKAPAVPLGTADTVIRGTHPDDPGFIPHTSGVFDVLVQNNYAEYGVAMCWGNKGRQTVVDGNIARFMWDYSYGSEGGENLVFSNNISINSAVAGFQSMYYGEKLLITGNLVIVRHEPMDPAFTTRASGAYMGQFLRLHHGPVNPEDRYGAGSVQITGNLFVNELADRPSGIAIEAGRDVMFSGNKVINGFLRKHGETVRVRKTEQDKGDEFSVEAAEGGDIAFKLVERVGGDASRITLTGNEFISRQPGDKPAVIINGAASNSIIKDNVFRKEASILKFTAEQLTNETTRARYRLSIGNNSTNAAPHAAVDIAPARAGQAIVQGNIVCGWQDAIRARNASPDGALTVVMTGNSADGTVAVEADSPRTVSKVDGNIALPKGFAH